MYWTLYALLFAVVCGIVANRRGRSAFAWGVLGGVTGVFALAVLICLEIPRQTQAAPSQQALVQAGSYKICPFCSENIIQTAIKCRYCQSDLPVPPQASKVEHMVRHNGILMRVSDIPDYSKSRET